MEIPEAKMRRHILIADDIDVNREMLGDLLSDEYDIETVKARIAKCIALSQRN